MTASTKAHLLLDSGPQIQGGAFLAPIEGDGTQEVPMILYGKGTPAGTLSPWKDLPQGSVWVSTDQTTFALWVKVYDNSANADWVARQGVEKMVCSKTFNVDSGAATADNDVIYFPVACTLTSADLVFSEATDSTGAGDCLIRIGSADNGEQYVASVTVGVSKAIGALTPLTLVTPTVAAASSLFIRHTGVATTDTGEYRVCIRYTENLPTA